jgi:hypothetical protein
MPKFLHVARISNFLTFLADFNLDLKHVVHSFLDELLSISYMVGKLEIFSFQPNLNHNKIPPIALNMS